MEVGPVQVLVLGFEGGEFSGEIVSELRRLRDHEIIRLIDLLFVTRNQDGSIEVLEHSDLSPQEARTYGALAGSLLGLNGEEGDEAEALGVSELAEEEEEEVWYLGDAIEPGTSAAIALLEHRWAIPLRDSVRRAGGRTLADAWIHPADAAALGAGRG